jgi:hypothetical protein
MTHLSDFKLATSKKKYNKLKQSSLVRFYPISLTFLVPNQTLYGFETDSLSRQVFCRFSGFSVSARGTFLKILKCHRQAISYVSTSLGFREFFSPCDQYSMTLTETIVQTGGHGPAPPLTQVLGVGPSVPVPAPSQA